MKSEYYERKFVEQVQWMRDVGLAQQKRTFEGILSPEGVEKMGKLLEEEFEQEVELLKNVPHYAFSHEKSKERCELHKKYADLKLKIYCQYKINSI